MRCALVALLCLAASPSFGLTDRSGCYEVQVLVAGMPARTFAYRGETFVLGQLGERYTLRVINRGPRRVEAVVTVDGRDAIDGEPGAFGKRGYLVPAHGSVDIEGWRISLGEAAAFRFSTVAASYAARTGSDRDVGVIGVALFPERTVPARPLEPLGVAPDGRENGPSAQGEARADTAPSAPSAPSAAARKSAGRPGLGTGYGEAVDSRVSEVAFERAAQRPAALLGVRYDDRAGLLALGIDVDGPAPSEPEVRLGARPFPGERDFAKPPPGWRR